MANKIDIDADQVLSDEGYKKHLKRHANKWERNVHFKLENTCYRFFFFFFFPSKN